MPKGAPNKKDYVFFDWEEGTRRGIGKYTQLYNRYRKERSKLIKNRDEDKFTRLEAWWRKVQGTEWLTSDVVWGTIDNYLSQHEEFTTGEQYDEEEDENLTAVLAPAVRLSEDNDVVMHDAAAIQPETQIQNYEDSCDFCCDNDWEDYAPNEMALDGMLRELAQSTYLTRVVEIHGYESVGRIIEAIKSLEEGGVSRTKIHAAFEHLHGAFEVSTKFSGQPNLLPNSREIDSLYRMFGDRFEYDTWYTCRDHHTHEKNKHAQCSKEDCENPCEILVKTKSIKRCLEDHALKAGFVQSLRWGPSVRESWEQGPQEKISSVWHGRAVDRKFADADNFVMGMTSNYIPILIQLFVDGWNPFNRDKNNRTLHVVTMRILNLHPDISQRYEYLDTLVHVENKDKPKSIRPHLKMIVDELIQLREDGMHLWDREHSQYVHVRVYLHLVISDHREQQLVLGCREAPHAQYPCVKCPVKGIAYDGRKVYPARDTNGHPNRIAYDASAQKTLITNEYDRRVRGTENVELFFDSLSDWQGDLCEFFRLPGWTMADVVTDAMHAVPNTAKHAQAYVSYPRSLDDKHYKKAKKYLVENEKGMMLRERLGLTVGANGELPAQAPWTYQKEKKSWALSFLWSCKTPSQYNGSIKSFFQPETDEEKEAFLPVAANSPNSAAWRDWVFSGLFNICLALMGVESRICTAFATLFANQRDAASRVVLVEDITKLNDELDAVMDDIEALCIPSEMRYCLHQTRHLHDQVPETSVQSDISGYVFESLHGWLGQMILKRSAPVASMVSKLNIISKLSAIRHLIAKEAEGVNTTSRGEVIVAVPKQRGELEGKNVSNYSDVGSEIIGLLRRLYRPTDQPEFWNDQFLSPVKAAGAVAAPVEVDPLLKILINPEQRTLRIMSYDRLVLNDIDVQPYKPEGETDNSHLLLKASHTLSTLPVLGRVKGIYEIILGGDDLAPFDHRLLLHVTRWDLHGLDEQLLACGLKRFGVLRRLDRTIGEDLLVPVGDIEDQAFLGRDPRTKENGTGQDLVLSKRSLRNITCRDPWESETTF